MRLWQVPGESELKEHEFLLIDKYLHELQHIATWLHLNTHTESTCQVQSPKSPAAAAGTSLHYTSPYIGTSTVGYKKFGDSGHAFEEEFFGGSIMHLIRNASKPFNVKIIA